MSPLASAEAETQHASSLAVIVPCYNEEAVIAATHERLLAALAPVDIHLELIYVDDGSRDTTLELLNQIQAKSDVTTILALSRNFGHQAAVTAGIEYVDADVVVIIDADLQDPPEVIPQMLAKWEEGYSVVYGRRRSREGETRFKRHSASLFYKVLSRMSEVEIPHDTGDFRLMDRRIVDVLKEMPEQHRFLRGMVSWVGFDQVAVEYDRHARLGGETKYSLKKMISLAFDGVFSFSYKPLRMAIWVGVATASIATLGIIYALAMRLFSDHWVSGWTFIVVSMLFIGGIQLLFLGVIGEYVARIYAESKSRPLFVYKQIKTSQKKRNE